MQCILIVNLIKLFWKIKLTNLWLLHAFTYQRPLHRFNYNDGNNTNKQLMRPKLYYVADKKLQGKI